jgi:outer membrane protein insertion porin family
MFTFSRRELLSGETIVCLTSDFPASLAAARSCIGMSSLNTTRWLIIRRLAIGLPVLLAGCAGPRPGYAPPVAAPAATRIESAPSAPASARPFSEGGAESASGEKAVVRGQNSALGADLPQRAGESFDGYSRSPMAVSGVAQTSAPGNAAQPPANPNSPLASPAPPVRAGQLPPPQGPSPTPYWPFGAGGNPPAANPNVFSPAFPQFQPRSNFLPPPPSQEAIVPPGRYVDIDAFLEEARTGRFMFGVGVNSEAGVTGQIVIDERNFDIFKFPTSFQDIINGTAWRGDGQGFRIEAIPGSEVQRYLVTFTQPYLFDTPISLNVSGFYFDRRFFDWDEQRLGGRLALGYRLTPDLSLSVAWRGENVNIHDLRVIGLPILDDVRGDNELYSGRVTLTHDTRDVPFAPTEGHLIQFSYEQVFGSYDYPRGEVDYRQYFLVRERPDGSGRHTLSYSFRFGVTGSQTPVFENYFAGGFSTLRGFDFRGASPRVAGVTVGGELFPLTADDMLKGVVFCDFGTVEEEIAIHAEDYRVAPGFGLRIAIPALGPAPLALDFAFPVAHEDTDDIENFSFFMGFGRS